MSHREKKHILVAGDAPELAEALRGILLKGQFEIRYAASAGEAVSLLMDRGIHLLVCDETVSGTPADGLMRKAREVAGNIPIIVTGDGAATGAFEFISLGVHAYIRRPFTEPENMRVAVTNALEPEDRPFAVLTREFKKQYPLDSERYFNEIAIAKQEWESAVDSYDAILLLVDREGIIRRCNSLLCSLTGLGFRDLLGRRWDDVLRDTGYLPVPGEFHLSGGIEFFHAAEGQWMLVHLNPFFEIVRGGESFFRQVITIQSITELKRVTGEVRNQREKISRQNIELQEAYERLKESQMQVLQQEKMASIGQLAAGVAHEINNPVGFISSNLGSFQKYAERLVEFIRLQTEAVRALETGTGSKEVLKSLGDRRNALKIDFIMEDVSSLILESLDGTERVKKIVQDLKSFSRVDDEEHKPADINAGLESTLNIVWNELKYKATLKKELGDLPLTRCNIGQLNQVFLNILVNAGHAIEKSGEIGLRTWADDRYVNVSISDTGSGIPEERLTRIFEPFFTTKEAGKGTGLGLSIAYDIVKKHGGHIDVKSKAGEGTVFTVRIPRERADGSPQAEDMP